MERPARLDQAQRQVVEQLGMRRRSAIAAEIARRVDDAGAKVVLPEPVHQDARRQRVVRANDPPRQSKAALGLAQAGLAAASASFEDAKPLYERSQRLFGNGDGLVQRMTPGKFAGNVHVSYDGVAASTSVFTEWLRCIAPDPPKAGESAV